MCALIYRLSKYNKDIIEEFWTFLSKVVSLVDKFLILGDFNIHVCCTRHQLMKEFTQLCDSLNLVQDVNGPTHTHGYTIDLVLSLKKTVCNINIKESGVSDHMFIMFDVLHPFQLPIVLNEVFFVRALTPSTAGEFKASLESPARSISEK